MKENFLNNEIAWKSFLSSVAKEITEYNGLYSWSIYSKYQMAFSRPLIEDDLLYLSKFKKFSAFYLSKDDIDILEKNYSVDKSKDFGVVIPIENFSLVGNNYIKIRTAINKCSRMGFEVLDNYKKFDDILDILNRWDDTCGEKHFQSRTGKNKYFFKNNFHKDGIPIFIYDKERLIAFGVLSKPNKDGCSAYVIGKALCYDYKGLSEFADVELYKAGQKFGIKEVNLGGGKPSVVTYKMKFPNAYKIESFDVRCTIKENIDSKYKNDTIEKKEETLFD